MFNLLPIHFNVLDFMTLGKMGIFQWSQWFWKWFKKKFRSETFYYSCKKVGCQNFFSKRGTRLKIKAKHERATMLKGFKSKSLFQLDVKH